MSEKVFLIHGWSVDSTATYQAMHLKLAAHGFELADIYLGRYVSLDNEIEVSDIAQAMHNALLKHLGPPPWTTPFHLITHSTGALVVKQWVVHNYRGAHAKNKALGNIVFLAGPHFGSRLAHHGRSMLSHALYFGDTGKRVLTSLELGSDFTWSSNESWLDNANWKDKGIRPFNLIGDRIENNFFKSRIFPAGFEKGSDMVVRVPAGNLNFRRFHLEGRSGKLTPVGEIAKIPFAALGDYVHSGAKAGIMNSITTKADPAGDVNLKLILQCLKVKTAAAYGKAFKDLATATAQTRAAKKPAFAQLDFRFSDDMGHAITDYSFVLGAIVDGKAKASKTVAHTHKNKIDESHFTVLLNLQKFEADLTYFFAFDARTGTELFHYEPDPLQVKVTGKRLSDIICAEQTTQIDVVLGRESSPNLFVFHPGDDNSLHVKWNRRGEITKEKIKPK